MSETCRFLQGLCVSHNTDKVEKICDIGLAALRAELERAKKEYAQAGSAMHKAEDENIALRARCEAQERVMAGLKVVIEKYARHDHTCWKGALNTLPEMPCICGLDKALSPPKEA